VLTISIHGHPRFAYPYFSGFTHEKGEGKGEGYNINYPLEEHIGFDDYYQTLKKAVQKISEFKPQYLVLALGLDTAKGDPTGTWPINAKNFQQIGQEIKSLNLPVLVVQEGGYLTRTLGQNAKAFFKGLSGQK